MNIKEKVKMPWKINKSLVKIIEQYDAQIANEKEGGEYRIEFYDKKDSIVEAEMLKSEFKDLPYPVKIGSHFWIVIYNTKDDSELKLSVWPVVSERYYHKSWLKERSLFPYIL